MARELTQEEAIVLVDQGTSCGSSGVLVVVRTNYFDRMLSDFTARLSIETGYSVCLAVDEALGEVNCGGLAKVSLSRHILENMGLFVPKRFGWLCGDYALYLARQSFPNKRYIWLIEPDVRINYCNYGDFFRLFEADQSDLIAPHLERAAPDYWWYPTMSWTTDDVWRCLFAFIRISDNAIDLCLAERKRFSRRLEARLMWANDEAFVSSTLASKRQSIKSMNDVVPNVCTKESFGFFKPFRGKDFEEFEVDNMIYHPVLYGNRYDQKIRRLLPHSNRSERLRLKLQRAITKIRSGRIPLLQK